MSLEGSMQTPMQDRMAKAFADRIEDELHRYEGLNSFLPNTNFCQIVESRFTEEGVILTIQKFDDTMYDLVLKPVQWRRHHGKKSD